jgi:hypothetical protein
MGSLWAAWREPCDAPRQPAAPRAVSAAVSVALSAGTFAATTAAMTAGDTERPQSAWRAMQSPPLSMLASNGNDHTQVRTVAILGYN